MSLPIISMLMTQIADYLQTNASRGSYHKHRMLCVVHDWCTSKCLQLNPTKLKLIWFRSRTSLHRLHGVDHSLYIGADIIAPLTVVRDLSVLLDSELSMTSHITKVSSVSYYQLRRLKQVRRVLGKALQLVSCRLLLSVDWITVMQSW